MLRITELESKWIKAGSFVVNASPTIVSATDMIWKPPHGSLRKTHAKIETNTGTENIITDASAIGKYRKAMKRR